MPVIELDMLIAFVNPLDKLHPVAVKVFSKIVKGELKGYSVASSAYLEYELILRSRGYPEDSIRLEIEAFRKLRDLGEVPLTSRVLVEASRLREQFNLTYFDSLHAASAILHDGRIASVDAAYSKIPELEVIDPRTLNREGLPHKRFSR